MQEAQEMMLSLDLNSAQLLRAVVRPCEEATIAVLASKIHSWDRTLDLARSHRIVPMLYARLDANREHLPAEVLGLIRREFERNALHCLTNAEELLKILQDFDSSKIPAMPFKGVVLGASVYGDLTARNAGDLDLLIHYRDLQRATEMLKQRGYQLMSKVREDGTPAVEDGFEFHFERPSDGMVLELRWRLELTQPRYRYNLGMDWVWPRRRSAKVAGADVPDMDPVSCLLVLCMHGTKHVWSRLAWICDVAKLLESTPELDWDFTQQEAKRVGLGRSLELGVLLAQRVAGARVPGEVLHRFERDRTVRKLAEFLDESLMERPRKMPSGWVPYNFKILGFRDRARTLLSPEFLRPNPRDRAWIKLPKALDPLYFLIRPVRILLDRTGR
jgi:hypothetical protein